jgi:hypothetical protein
MNLPALLIVLQQYLAQAHGALLTLIKTLVGRVNAHEADLDNPHEVDALQVGLDQVQNWPPATLQQAQDGVNNSSYMTPRRVAQTLENKLYAPLAQAFEDATKDLNNS